MQVFDRSHKLIRVAWHFAAGQAPNQALNRVEGLEGNVGGTCAV
jgi:hypothetical protein